MIALDTNVLLRYLAQDDERQSPIATLLIEETLSEESPGFVALAVICELVWLLGRRYAMGRAGVVAMLRELLDAPQMLVEHAALVEQALEAADQDIPDMIIQGVGRLNGCSKMLTFDKKLARVDGVELLSA